METLLRYTVAMQFRLRPAKPLTFLAALSLAGCDAASQSLADGGDPLAGGDSAPAGGNSWVKDFDPEEAQRDAEARPGAGSDAAHQAGPIDTTMPRDVPVSNARPAPRPGRAAAASNVYYSGCKAVRAAGRAPLYSHQPGYRPEMDGDGDGIACEPRRR
ncbi:excalibur calcium-binding domain-containing protein [Qipengyuania sp. JC766]|uniref:excalibur calcium-binding domain-containing protein n=1 Tax=Qipengyuania sp. JC766 TaxID=3232139 RepID=UPI003457DDAA